MEISTRGKNVTPSSTLAMNAIANQLKAEGKKVVNFGVGEPDFDTPLYIKEAAIHAMLTGLTKYTPVSGLLELRQAICSRFKNDYNLEYKPDEILVSNGAKHAIFNVLQALIDTGDEVIIPSPYWVSYPEMVKLCDGVPVIINADPKNDFKITPSELEKSITEKTKLFILNSPGNPTGTVYTLDELKGLSDILVKHKIYVISDEIYDKLIYDGEKHHSIASINDEIKNLTFIINGVSKTYAMTGWRIGYVAGNKEAIKIMTDIQSHATSNANSIAQYAAMIALQGGEKELSNMVAEFDKRRKYMIEKMEEYGINYVRPKGAFYVMMNIASYKGKSINGELIDSSDKFAELLLKYNGAATVAGSGFGNDNYIRLSYATSLEDIKLGLENINNFINSLR
ncbi:MAG: pyridoxal phosphate-dependent aminotransferase [Thermoanaerobacteraceae bacterium]|nr:pyridoxal phosphate-dependent aminotransferase [Thermoanaerobacteraceae bacterium]